MDQWHEKQTSREIAGGHTTVSGEDLVLIVPLIRVRRVVGIHVPATVVVVPVRVDQASHQTISYPRPSMPLPFDYSQSCIVFET